MKKRLAAIIFFAGTFLFTACIRKDSAADVTNVEETMDNKVTISEQESEQTVAGMDLRYTAYLDDSHFYRDSVDVNWYGENGWIPIEISIEQWEVREEPDESKIAIRDRERFEKEKRLLINNSGKEAVLRYCYLDIAVENQGNMEYDFYPGSIRLVQRIPDDRYTDLGYAAHRIDMPESWAECAECDITSLSGFCILEPGRKQILHYVFMVTEEELKYPLYINASTETSDEYNERKGIYEPTSNENCKYLYVTGEEGK